MSKEIEIPFQGNSMLPSLQPGDQLKVEVCGLDQLKENDIAVITECDELVCHRVIKKNQGLYLKGDAAIRLLNLDESLMTWGRVIQIQRNGQLIQDVKLSKLKYYLNLYYTQNESKYLRWFIKKLNHLLI